MTKRDVDRLRYDPTGPARQVLYDDEVPGFGVRVYPSGRKAYVLWYRNRGGRSRLITLGLYGTLTLPEARRRARRTLVDVEAGADPVEERRQARRGTTLREFAAVYMERHAKPHKKTWKADLLRLEKHILPALGSRRLDDVKRPDVARMHAKIGARAPYEANRVLALVSVLFTKAVEWGYLEEGHVNPAARIQQFKERSRDRWVTPEALPVLLAAIDAETSPYVRAVLRLALLTGMRRGELLSLRWSDVNLSRREIHLADTKAGRSHVVPLSAEAAELLRGVPKMLGNPYVFPSPTEPGAHLHDLKGPWERVRARFWLGTHPDEADALRERAKADVEKRSKHADRGDRAVAARLHALATATAKERGEELRFHDVRRTVGSMLAIAGHSLPLIGKVLNHSNPSTTAIYARIAEDAARRALEDHGRRIVEAGGYSKSAASR